MILFPYSHTIIPGPDYTKHELAGGKLAEGMSEVDGRKYEVGAAAILLCKSNLISSSH